MSLYAASAAKTNLWANYRIFAKRFPIQHGTLWRYSINDIGADKYPLTSFGLLSQRSRSANVKCLMLIRQSVFILFMQRRG